MKIWLLLVFVRMQTNSTKIEFHSKLKLKEYQSYFFLQFFYDLTAHDLYPAKFLFLATVKKSAF